VPCPGSARSIHKLWLIPENSMKKTAFYLILFLSLRLLVGCSQPTQQTGQSVQHMDPFYNLNMNDYPLLHLPLIRPIEAKREDGRSPWRVLLPNSPSVHVPNRKDNFIYAYDIEELEKFDISNGIIMAYSAYVDKEADAYIQDNYYHWFVLIPDKDIAKRFHTQEEFLAYLQTLGLKDPDWQKPDAAYDQFKKTGCLAWFPDCK
jgi:hypothetical protein